MQSPPGCLWHPGGLFSWEASRLQVDGPVLQAKEHGGGGGGHPLGHPLVGQQRVLLKADGGDGGGAQQVGAELRKLYSWNDTNKLIDN